jgi:CheY-like chemotaxis protein
LENKVLDPATPILIVEDNPQFAAILNRLLAAEYNLKKTTILTSVEEARMRITATPDEFKLIFLDFNFPTGMNGGEFLEYMAENNLLEGKVVFLISSDPTAQTLHQVLKVGAAGIIAKPFDREELRRQLERAARLINMNMTDSF